MKIKLGLYLASFLILAVGLTAIAEENNLKALSESEYKELVSGYDKGNDCVFSRTIKSWSILNNNSLIIYAPTKSHPYYVKLSRPAFRIKFVNSIGVYSKFDNRFCPYGNNSLFIDGDEYTISAITKLDKDTAKQLIAYNKKKAAK